MEQSTVAMQYVGPFGRKGRTARCDGVGEFYYLDVVPIPAHIVPTLPASDWRKADDLCQYQRLDGKICGADRLVEGSKFCAIHHEELFGPPVKSKRKKDSASATVE